MKIFWILSIALLIVEFSNGHSHPHGHQIQIQFTNGTQGTDFDYAGLKKVFEHPEVRDRKIVTLSIIGAYRKGKSFFLDYCLRFLYGNYKSINTMSTFVKNENWWGEPVEPLAGFSWRSGSDADTKGILMWSDVFLHEENGEKVAIILMDTQGLFELQRSISTDAKIFGITSFLSSILILNLNDVIQENELEYLKTVTDFSKITIQRQNDKSLKISSKPFQNLMFLVRDWSDEEVGFGFKGGEKYLAKVFDFRNNNEGAQSVRDNLKNSYDLISAYLMPHPGKKVRSLSYDGQWSQLDDDFQIQIKDLIESLLSPANLIKKKIFGRETNGHEMLNYATMLFLAFQSSNIPDIDSLFNVVVETELAKLAEIHIEDYKKAIKDSIDYDKPNFVTSLENSHRTIQLHVISKFIDTQKMDDGKLEKKYENLIRQSTQNFFDDWKVGVFAIYDKKVAGKINKEEAERKMVEYHKLQLELERVNAERRIESEIRKMKGSLAYQISVVLCKIVTLGAADC